MCIPSFVLIGCCASECDMPIYVPIVMYSLRLFMLFYKNVYNVVYMLISSEL